MSVQTYPTPTPDAVLKDDRPLGKVALGVAVYPNPNLTSPIAESDVTNLVSDLALKAPLASPTFTGTPAAPTPSANDNSTKLATTAYVDSALASFDIKPDVAYASTSALPANTYSNGSSGVGATLTGNVNGPLIIDGVTLAIGQAGERVLVAAEATQANDGWYTITQVGVIAVSPYILTRATESDQATEIGAGYLTGVVAPNTVTPGANNGKVFISIAADPFVVGTTALTFSQVGGTYSAGNGLTLSGSVFTIDTSITVDKTTAQTLTTKTLTSPVLNTGVSGTAVDTDSTMAANSDTLLASQKATKTALALKAPLASPALTGSPTAPTQAATDNSTKLATDGFVVGQNLIAGTLAPAGVGSFPPNAYLPSLTAGGDLTGTLPSPSVLGWRAQSLNSSFSAPTAGDMPIYDGSQWICGTVGSWPSRAATQTYTPTLAQGTSTNIAKTVNTANFIQIGGLVMVWVRLTPTGTGTAGSDVTVSLPIAAATTSIQVGSGTVALGANKLKVMATINASGTIAFRRTDDATTTTNAGTAPNVAVANSGDSISFFAMYNAA